MESVSVERLDHIGAVAAVIKDLGVIEMIDAHLGRHDQEEITAGEAVAGMVLNGWGFSDRPWTLTPQFFANKPLDLLLHEDVRVEMFNRFKLGRTLDEAHAYGCDLLFGELALAVCAPERIDARFNKQLFHLQAKRFETPSQAQEALSGLAKKWRYHQVESYELIDHKRYGKTGRLTAETPISATQWQMQAQVRLDAERIEDATQHTTCFVVGTNIIQGLLMVMTLALLVYSVAQRRLRQELARHNETIPNQINQPTSRPTLRWVFQVSEGIERVRVTVDGQVRDLITGLNEAKIKILHLFGEQVCHVYQLPSG